MCYFTSIEELNRARAEIDPDITDDEVIAEFRRRVVAGRFGDRALLMPSEMDYSGMWSALCSQITAWEARFGFDHPVVFEVRRAVHELAARRPNALAVFALATTRYGREEDEGR